MEKCNNRRLHVIQIEMDEDEANDVAIDEEPELDPCIRTAGLRIRRRR